VYWGSSNLDFITCRYFGWSFVLSDKDFVAECNDCREHKFLMDYLSFCCEFCFRWSGCCG
jgi:hypothetical protein